LGVYLTGSLALDDYLPGRSDIDVAMVVRRSMTAAEKHAMVESLRHSALRCPTRGLELVVYRADAVGHGLLAPAFELELNDGPRMSYHVNYAAAERDPADGLFWYALDRDIVAQRGVALVGPPAREVFGRLTESDLRAAVVDSLRWHAEHSAGLDFSNAVLNACRSLVRVETGQWLGKSLAGQRAIALGAPEEVVESALEQRRTGAEAGADAGPFIRYAHARLESP